MRECSGINLFSQTCWEQCYSSYLTEVSVDCLVSTMGMRTVPWMTDGIPRLKPRCLQWGLTHAKIKLGHPKVKGVHLKYKRDHPQLLKKNGKVSSPLINYHPFWNSNLHFIQKNLPFGWSKIPKSSKSMESYMLFSSINLHVWMIFPQKPGICPCFTTCSAGAGGAALAAPVAEPGITWAMDPLV